MQALMALVAISGYRARETWRDALAKYPRSNALRRRAEATDRELRTIIDAALDPKTRVDATLRELFQDLREVRTRASP